MILQQLLATTAPLKRSTRLVRCRDVAQAGFSLPELMISLLLVSVLLALGLPLFRGFIIEQRLRAVSTDLRAALMTTRSEAVKRNRDVELRPSADGWSAGWTIPDPEGDDLPAIFNHVQSGDITIAGPAEAEFTAFGRAVAAVEFEIDVGPEASGTMTCLQLQMDGRSTSFKGACPDD